jgi:hypothetical protein
MPLSTSPLPSALPVIHYHALLAFLLFFLLPPLLLLPKTLKNNRWSFINSNSVSMASQLRYKYTSFSKRFRRHAICCFPLPSVMNQKFYNSIVTDTILWYRSLDNHTFFFSTDQILIPCRLPMVSSRSSFSQAFNHTALT